VVFDVTLLLAEALIVMADGMVDEATSWVKGEGAVCAMLSWGKV